MDIGSAYTVRFLMALATAQHTLSHFAGELQNRAEVERVVVYPFKPKVACRMIYDARGLPTECSGDDFGVSVNLRNGAMVDWWLELYWHEQGWIIEHNVHKSDADEDGSHVAVAFAPWEGKTFEALIAQLGTAVRELVATVNDAGLFE